MSPPMPGVIGEFVPPATVNPNAVVAPGGKIIGVDPDPNVRFEILRDVSKPYR